MNLFFQETFENGKKTQFIPKIWKSISLDVEMFDEHSEALVDIQEDYPKRKKPGSSIKEWVEPFKTCVPKIHTIRKDSKCLWRKDVTIHFKQWIDKPYRSRTYNFMPLIQVKKVQLIKIDYNKKVIFKNGNEYPIVSISGRILDFETVGTLAVNDGFDSIDHFFSYFNESFEGVVIHWTNFKY